jgi:hypothetical protein
VESEVSGASRATLCLLYMCSLSLYDAA